MQLKILGVGNSPLLSVKVKTLDDDANLLNVSALARMLGVHRSTFLSRVANSGLEAAILHFTAIKKQRDVLATRSEKDAAAFIAACNANISNNATH
ncbi:TPA: hypothetical protein MIU83_24980 [Klebsiella pneumoniae]|uniref:hypothetical protein n=1 Tax=Klebsiella TaxID=570 RepID=UPI001CA556E8|nr:MULTISPECIES: hypothetical protein [Klebsiella]HEO9849882.1 hypothetical protein [Klebsiella pneumoniae subsp. pneumoniae]MBW5986010.1 hypothetical protein [Klebsiella quasipneumoniae]MDV1057759.1 hypothetical protein [Klebsiella quasipneumoniae subsp. similipneumoniae]UMD82359.1 hypothetical protein JJ527_20380 [Klebsiella pneumoniae]HBT6943818.1 hypothetical protein [Klebsiella pneumoniae]